MVKVNDIDSRVGCLACDARFISQIRMGLALGMGNLLRVLCYRVGLKTGLHRACRLKAVLPDGPFFLPAKAIQPGFTPCEHWRNHALYFGWIHLPIGDAPPDWHLNPLSGKRLSAPHKPWWKIPDFDESIGDIKNIWEASRFDWILTGAQQAIAGDNRAVPRLNTWLADWCKHNPAYLGPNWKCGQEASIRVMHLAMGAFLLGQHREPSAALLSLVRVHLQRIVPTHTYATAQNNNHGTSEAAALFIGGTWLLGVRDSTDARRWAMLGRRLLENRVACLVAPDGSFSQYSINYHRVLLDTLCMVEIWCRAMQLPVFSERFYNRCRAAAEWLRTWVDPENGNAPNLGANDGAWLMPISNTDYRDYRPCVRLSYDLLKKTGLYPGAEGDALSAILKIGTALPPTDRGSISRVFPDGGFVALRGTGSWAMIRFANFRFRPSHSDCLHIDLWHRGHNLLRDGGSYSYHAESCWLDYFSGTASHNTVQFDDRNQMPRLSRFLFGAWLKMDECTDIQQNGQVYSWTGAYTDWQKARHRRTVSVSGDTWWVRDDICGYKEKAVLRWRLMPEDWVLKGECCSSKFARITVHTRAPVRRIEMVTGWESLYYHQKTEIPVLEMEVGPGQWTLETEIHLTS